MKNSMRETTEAGKLRLHKMDMDGIYILTILAVIVKNPHFSLLIFNMNSGSMKRLASINFGLDEVTGSSGEEEKEQRDLFEVVCKQRFSGADDDIEKCKDKLGDDSDDLTTEEEDPWESRTKEIEFGSNLFSSGTELHTPADSLRTNQNLSTVSATVIDSPKKVKFRDI